MCVIAASNPLDTACHPLSCKMLIERAFASQCRVGFRISPSSRAFGMDAPVVQHARNVMNRIDTDMLDAPQYEVVVLRTLNANAEAAHRI